VLIREQALRIARHRWAERRLFDIVGAWSLDEPDADVARHFAAQARHHAWRASMWDVVRPVLHDVDTMPDVPGSTIEAFDAVDRSSTTAERLTAVGQVLAVLVGRYEHDLASTDPVADAPVIRVLRLVISDAKEDWQAAALLQRSVVRTEEDVDRAAAHQSRLEVVLVALNAED
jgi:hypothetical protein